MRNCPNCGNPVGDAEAKCARCGMPQTPLTPSGQTGTVVTPTQFPIPTPPSAGPPPPAPYPPPQYYPQPPMIQPLADGVHGKPSDYLQSLLKPDERVLYYRELKMLGGREICGTTDRMIYLESSMGSKEFNDVPYSNIAGVSFKSEWSIGMLIGAAVCIILGVYLALNSGNQTGLIIALVLLIVGLILVMFARSQRLVLKMSGGNITVVVPRLNITNVVREVSVHVTSMRR